ncbi:MAG: aldolase/citrate lyase family protein, partial [candidate division WOR-3 bacterium]
MTEFSEAGRRGKDVRSDCWVRIVPRSSGGVRLTVMSRVEVMYGRAIRKLIRDELAFFGVEHALVEVEDSGALPFVLMARIEAAVKRLRPTERRSYLPEMPEYARAPTHRERLRRSRLYLPGNEPKFMINVGLHGPDGVILDLEDSVAPGSKDEALILVRNALRQVDFMGAERMVRINPLPRGLDEIRELASCNVHMFLIPKCESADTVRKVDSCLQEANNSHSMQADTG